MNGIFFGIVLIAFLVAGWRQIYWRPPSADAVSPMQALANGMVETAGSSVTLAIGLVGVMALFLGLMKVAEEGGMLTIIAKTIRPLMVRLFPEVPPDHPAMGAMILNMSANALGLGNAATPFGIRAMQELDKLVPEIDNALQTNEFPDYTPEITSIGLPPWMIDKKEQPDYDPNLHEEVQLY